MLVEVEVVLGGVSIRREVVCVRLVISVGEAPVGSGVVVLGEGVCVELDDNGVVGE